MVWRLSTSFSSTNRREETKPEKRGVLVTRITTDPAREFTQKRLDEGAKNGTVNGSLALLRRMLSVTHEDGKIQAKPKIRLLKPGPGRKSFLLRDKFNELLGHIPVKTKPLIVFLYYCGVRLGEALQIEWSQVNLEEDRATAGRSHPDA